MAQLGIRDLEEMADQCIFCFMQWPLTTRNLESLSSIKMVNSSKQHPI